MRRLSMSFRAEGEESRLPHGRDPSSHALLGMTKLPWTGRFRLACDSQLVRASTRTREQKIAPEIGDARHATQPHDAIQFAAKDLQHVCDTRFARDRQAPKLRPADQTGRGAERE